MPASKVHDMLWIAQKHYLRLPLCFLAGAFFGGRAADFLPEGAFLRGAAFTLRAALALARSPRFDFADFFPPVPDFFEAPLRAPERDLFNAPTFSLTLATAACADDFVPS